MRHAASTQCLHGTHNVDHLGTKRPVMCHVLALTHPSTPPPARRPQETAERGDVRWPSTTAEAGSVATTSAAPGRISSVTTTASAPQWGGAAGSAPAAGAAGTAATTDSNGAAGAAPPSPQALVAAGHVTAPDSPAMHGVLGQAGPGTATVGAGDGAGPERSAFSAASDGMSRADSGWAGCGGAVVGKGRRAHSRVRCAYSCRDLRNFCPPTSSCCQPQSTGPTPPGLASPHNAPHAPQAHDAAARLCAARLAAHFDRLAAGGDVPPAHRHPLHPLHPHLQERRVLCAAAAGAPPTRPP